MTEEFEKIKSQIGACKNQHGSGKERIMQCLNQMGFVS